MLISKLCAFYFIIPIILARPQVKGFILSYKINFKSMDQSVSVKALYSFCPQDADSNIMPQNIVHIVQSEWMDLNFTCQLLRQTKIILQANTNSLMNWNHRLVSLYHYQLPFKHNLSRINAYLIFKSLHCPFHMPLHYLNKA